MNKLLADAIDAHGGLERWKRFVTVETRAVSGGELFRLKQTPSPAEPLHFTVKTVEQMSSVIVPGADGTPDRRSVMRPDRVTLETFDGKVLAALGDPRRSFVGHNLDTPWDPLQRLYFGSYAMWMYLTTPFSLAIEGAQVWDIDPLEEDEETWRGIRVVMPPGFATHSRAQEYFFGDDRLLRRQDYTVDIVEGMRVANYAQDIVDVNGIKLPSKRRAYGCNKKYEVLRDRLMVSLDFTSLRANDSRGAIF
jgi:hypothetical protein